MAAKVSNAPLVRKETVEAFKRYETNVNAPDAMVVLLSDLYAGTPASGLTAAHTDALAKMVSDIKGRAWLARNPHAAKMPLKDQIAKGRPDPARRGDGTPIRAVIKAAPMRSKDFWDTLLQNTKSAGVIGKVCGDAATIFNGRETKGTIPGEKWIVAAVKDEITKKRGGGKTKKWKASRHIKEMLDHAKSLGVKAHEAIAGAQLAMIVTALKKMQARAVAADKAAE